MSCRFLSAIGIPRKRDCANLRLIGFTPKTAGAAADARGLWSPGDHSCCYSDWNELGASLVSVIDRYGHLFLSITLGFPTLVSHLLGGMLYLPLLLSAIGTARALSENSLLKWVDHLPLASEIIPNIPEHFMGHHARTPFAISEDGGTLHVAYVEGSRYLPNSNMKVHVQKLAPADFEILGGPCTIDGAEEASGLVSLNDGGFAALTSMNFTGDTEYDIPVVVRYDQDCKSIWTRPVGGKTVPMAWLDDWKQPAYYRAPRLDGDLKYSPGNRTFAAFFRTSYYGEWQGHGGDMIVYIDDNDDKGQIMVNYGTKHKGTETVTEPISKRDNNYSLVQRCPHEYGLAIAPANEAPFPAVCTDDEGSIRLVTDLWLGGGNETRIGQQTPSEAFAGEAFGGVQGSYSVMDRIGDDAYLMAWVSRPTIPWDEKQIDNCVPIPGKCTTGWCGNKFKQCDDEAKSRSVQVIRLDNKVIVGDKILGDIRRVPKDPVTITPFRQNVDCSNARIGTFNREIALLTWEEDEVEECKILSGCKSRKYTGTVFQKLDENGNKVEESLKSTDVFVSGDIIQIWDQICWPYVHMDWNTTKEELVKYPTEHTHEHDDKAGPFPTVNKLSFACVVGME
ncbi:hypothetical protein K458DRAFT_488527 [Lentithecium fluviatile CBS 122367]|uniref:Uncharacterized protein n=1 Tax=Lentithecium fluviatile CBS 122367 TaxID=1168545 RepID=A0A6G1IXF6_9PLEO|nr:hypothetical protein K458DRAFT_488527 [Lentithecium fluviatile CBS 122367]